MPKVSQQHRDERREQILAAARRCFLRDGFHATSMQDLFAEAGLSSGAVYRYFAGKDDVIVAIAQENMRGVAAMIHQIAVEQPDQSVGGLLAGVLEIVETKHTNDGVGTLALLVWSEALRNAKLAEQLTMWFELIRNDIATVVLAAQRRGDLPADVATESLTNVLVAILPGFILQMAVTGPSAAPGMGDAVRALWP